MTRVDVPDSYEKNHVHIVPDRDLTSGDFVVGPRTGDVVVKSDTARDASVRRDDDGQRYVDTAWPDAVRAFFAEEFGASYGDDADTDAETCQAVKSDGEVCGRELPCPYHSDDGEDS